MMEQLPAEDAARWITRDKVVHNHIVHANDGRQVRADRMTTFANTALQVLLLGQTRPEVPTTPEDLCAAADVAVAIAERMVLKMEAQDGNG